jgi:5'-nucleotidase
MFRKLGLLISLLALALLASVAAAQDEEFQLTILHTNDTHSHHEPQGSGDGGVARQASVQNQIMADGGNVLLLDAGDRFTGTLFHQQYRGADQVQIMNALGYDAMTLGNHEFDDGEDVLQAFASGLEFPIITANVDFSAHPELDALIEPFVVLEVGGQQIGVIGLTTADTPFSSSPADDVLFSADYADAVAAAVEELTAQGVNKIILLTHVGVGVDLPLLESLVGVDVVLGGHSHTLFGNAYTAAGDNAYPVRVETTAGEPLVYAQAGSNNVYLGRMDVTFDANGLISAAAGDTILLSRYITPDPGLEAIIAELAGPVEALRAEPIGATASELLVGDRTVCRVEECALGNLITDALRVETGAQIAITNGGGIRADIDAGDITVGEVLTVLPFGNLTATLELTGADVIAALENGVSAISVGEGGVISRDGLGGRFPQVSGIRFTWDATQEAGSRIVSAEVLGENGEYTAIDPAAIYTVATNDFMRRGGDEYDVFADNAINPYDFGKPLDQVLSEYLVSLGEVTPTSEGRITLVNATIEAGS